MSEENNVSGKKNKLFILVPVIILVIAALFVIVPKMTKADPIEIGNYVVYEESGYDGYGMASDPYIDWDKLTADYQKKIKLSKIGKETFEGGVSESAIQAMFKLSFTVEGEVYHDLSNGDEVPFKINITDPGVLKYFKNEIVSGEGTYTISGLEEKEKRDLFESLQISFEGVDGRGRIRACLADENVNNYLNYRVVEEDKDGNLSNGDVITLKLTLYPFEKAVEELGYLPETLEKEITVSGLGHYMLDANEMSEAELNDLIEFAQSKVITAKDIDTINSISYKGTYLKYETDNPYIGNQFYIVFGMNVTAHDYTNAYIGDFDVYQYIRFDDVIVKEDGSINRGEIPVQPGRDSFLTNHGSLVYGSKTLDDLREAINRYEMRDNITQIDNLFE